MVNNTWKTVTLDQIGTFQKGTGISRAESNSGTLPAVRYGELYTVHNNYIREYTSCVSREVASKALRVHYGDILFTCSGENKEDIAKCAAIIDNSEVYVGGDIIVLTPTEKVDPFFMGFILNTQSVIQQRAQKAQGDAIVHISTNSIKSIEITIPEYLEQVKIAEALSDIDTLIANLEKLIAKYELIKKACLQQMFPQNGEKVPQMRLPGFTGAWEQRKLSEVADFSKGQGYTKSDLRETGTPIILYGRLYTKYQSIIREVDTFADVISGAVLSKGGEVILPSSGETAEDIAIAASVEKSSILLGGGLNVVLPHKEIESAFLAIEISYGSPHNELAKQAQGKSIVHLYNEDLKKVVVSYPTVEEQRKIIGVFDNLDRLITLHQHKLEKVRQIKQGMMSELLTGRIRLL